MQRFKKIGIAMALSSLAACANITPMTIGADKPATAQRALDHVRLSEAWNTEAVVKEGASSVVLLSPHGVPAELKAKKLVMDLDPGATIKDVVAILGKLGVPVILANQEVASKEFYLPHFNGTLGTLLSAITRATDVWFAWSDGAVVVTPTERIGISVPQESGFAEQLAKGLDAFGVSGKSISWEAGMAVMDVTPSQFRKFRSYLERMTANAAVVSMQIAVINVTLDQTAKQGIDWDGLQLSVLHGGNIADVGAWQTAYGLGGRNPAHGGGGGAPIDPTTGMPVTGGVAPAPTVPGAAVAALGLAGGAMHAALFSNRFSFSGLFDFLETYGDAETQQNVVLKTVTGNPVEFKSLTQIPYVSEIGVTTTGAVGGSSTLGSSKTAKADDGITLKLTPTYDAAANSVTIQMDLAIKAVIGFNELSAGSQLGTLTQPTTGDRSFTDTLRLRPGQTAVVGGLSYDSVSNSKSVPTFLRGMKLDSESLTVKRQAMFIVVRPTVTKIGQVLVDEAGDTFDLFPQGKVEPAGARGK